MISGIILTHGPIASAIIKSAETILGKVDNIYPLSTTGFSLRDLVAKLDEIIANEKSDSGILIMASLKGGTCWNAAVAVARKNENIKVVSGVNLPMIISFVTKRNRLSLDDLMQTIYQDGIKGIDLFNETTRD